MVPTTQGRPHGHCQLLSADQDLKVSLPTALGLPTNLSSQTRIKAADQVKAGPALAAVAMHVTHALSLLRAAPPGDQRTRQPGVATLGQSLGH